MIIHGQELDEVLQTRDGLQPSAPDALARSPCLWRDGVLRGFGLSYDSGGGGGVPSRPEGGDKDSQGGGFGDGEKELDVKS